MNRHKSENSRRIFTFIISCTPEASVTPLKVGAWRLEFPPGPQGRYRLAQLDDYSHQSRKSFPWQPPVTLSLQARVSAPALPGTWGFGLWNDPFSLSLGFGGVLWIDNQYAAFPPDGRLSYGTLASPESEWLEIRLLEIIA